MAQIRKREFVHHTSKCLKAVELGQDLVITHNGAPRLKLIKIKQHSLQQLIGCAGNIQIKGDINTPILADFFDDLA